MHNFSDIIILGGGHFGNRPILRIGVDRAVCESRISNSVVRRRSIEGGHNTVDGFIDGLVGIIVGEIVFEFESVIVGVNISVTEFMVIAAIAGCIRRAKGVSMTASCNHVGKIRGA